MKILFLTLEFVSPIFSGNGSLSRCAIRGLIGLNHDIFVICGRSESVVAPTTAQLHEAIVEDSSSTLLSELTHAHLFGQSIPLPVWNRTDRKSSYEIYARGVAEAVNEVEHFNPDVVIFVDWTGAVAWQSLLSNSTNLRSKPAVFANFCVYHATSSASDEDRIFYKEKEQAAMDLAQMCFPLCQADCKLLKNLRNSIAVTPLVPPLRYAILSALADAKSATITPPSTATCVRSMPPLGHASTSRIYLTCCVRLHPAKNVELFPELVLSLKNRGFFERFPHIVPLMCGAAADPGYAQTVESRLLAIVPQARVITEFLSARPLCEILQQTALNIHPGLYEAYGMTIIEAAANGAPSLIDNRGFIGAIEMLRPDHDEIFQFPFPQRTTATDAYDQLAQFIEDIIFSNANHYAKVQENGFVRSTSWDEPAYARSLTHHLQTMLEANENKHIKT